MEKYNIFVCFALKFALHVKNKAKLKLALQVKNKAKLKFASHEKNKAKLKFALHVKKKKQKYILFFYTSSFLI